MCSSVPFIATMLVPQKRKGDTRMAADTSDASAPSDSDGFDDSDVDVDAGEDAAMLGLGGASGVYVRQPQVLGLGKPLFRRLGSVAHTLQALGLGSRVMPSSQRADGIPPSGHTTLTEVPDLASTESPRRTALFRRCVAWHISRKWFGSRIAGNADQS